MNEATDRTTPPRASRRAALLAAPAALAAVPMPAPACTPSAMERMAGEAIAAERLSLALWDKLGTTKEEEDANLPRCNAASRVANDLGERLMMMEGKTFADAVAKARAAYLFAEKDAAGVMKSEHVAHGLLISLCEDVLALAGEPVPR